MLRLGLLLMATCAFALPAQSLSCANWIGAADVEDAYREIEVIFEGYAVEIEDAFADQKTRNGLKFRFGKEYEDIAPRYRTRFLVVRSFKNAETRLIDTWQTDLDRRLGARKFEPNQKYLVFAGTILGLEPTQWLTVSPCLSAIDLTLADFDDYLRGLDTAH